MGLNNVETDQVVQAVRPFLPECNRYVLHTYYDFETTPLILLFPNYSKNQAKYYAGLNLTFRWNPSKTS